MGDDVGIVERQLRHQRLDNAFEIALAQQWLRDLAAALDQLIDGRARRLSAARPSYDGVDIVRREGGIQFRVAETQPPAQHAAVGREAFRADGVTHYSDGVLHYSAVVAHCKMFCRQAESAARLNTALLL